MLRTGGCPDSGENWEEGCYQLGCRLAKEVAVRYLESKAAELDKQRPDGYRVKNTNPRTLVTRFGDVTFKRQLYQDRQGEYHFLLDEYLNVWCELAYYDQPSKSAKARSGRPNSRLSQIQKLCSATFAASLAHMPRVLKNGVMEVKMD